MQFGQQRYFSVRAHTLNQLESPFAYINVAASLIVRVAAPAEIPAGLALLKEPRDCGIHVLIVRFAPSKGETNIRFGSTFAYNGIIDQDL
jgi:hypothetical protein